MKPREFFNTEPRPAKVRPPFTGHVNQTWKCIVCGHDMKGKCTPAGRFDSASCFYCYTEFYVDSDGTIAACDIPKPIVRFKSWFRAALAWLRILAAGQFSDGGPIPDDNPTAKPSVSQDAQDEALFLGNELAFWLDPRRWDSVNPNKEVFWMREHKPYGSAVFVRPESKEPALQIDRERAYIARWNKQWK